MKKNISFFISLLLFTVVVSAQTNNGLPDVNKLMKMSPAELEAYKKKMIKEQTDKASNLAQQHNLNVNLAASPGYEIKPPVKDVARLSLIPSRPPTRQQLVTGVQASMNQLKQGIPAPKIQEIQQFTATKPVTSIHDAAVTSFYNNDPAEGMMLMMYAVSVSPDSLQMVNNLGAMLNMIGAEHMALPMLQYCMEKVPESSSVLNNIGQSFLGLGDVLKAADYLNRCLEIDSLNVEANHSMGMLKMFKKEYKEAIQFFEREMSVAIRSSSMAMAYKTGEPFDLKELTRRKHERNGVPKRNHFEEITMGKFSIPDLPANSRDIKTRLPELAAYGASVQAESLHWLDVMNTVNRRAAYRGANENHGLYSDLVDAMLEELSKEFKPEYLNNYSDDDAAWVSERLQMAGMLIEKVTCPVLPPGSSLDAQHASDVKCCEDNKRPIADAAISEVAAHMEKIFRAGQSRWKSYINQLVAVVQLDPDASNQALVYGAVSGYFTYLNWGAVFFTAGDMNNLLVACKDNYRREEMDSIITADRNWRLACPDWLNLSVDLGGVTVKADCTKYAVEAGKSFTVGFEHEFATGNSTFLAGPATKLEFLGGMIKAESKTQFFLTFDKNKEFADFGVKNTMKIGASANPFKFGGIKLGANLGSVEISNSVSINSGYKPAVKTNGLSKWFNRN